jgi:hypothetical protein
VIKQQCQNNAKTAHALDLNIQAARGIPIRQEHNNSQRTTRDANSDQHFVPGSILDTATSFTDSGYVSMSSDGVKSASRSSSFFPERHQTSQDNAVVAESSGT